ncbi:TonB family protein [Thermanaerovibrio acidaminovorans DSM 6589]|uniref:TonB family protein n=1 Tax=Thermanaerovibrio acidaminovorans (strain ATCC 49978 / DSM 6589 / Su883) TaxID=525903 RepID=D1B6V3_THEAS|nr:energy transducer TonB [Thermanaerovibrio acidaminovorans]ACZ19744.1 TonB family protein [Thermanaerovibrio acidaminovorans DSM 6589]
MRRALPFLLASLWIHWAVLGIITPRSHQPPGIHVMRITIETAPTAPPSVTPGADPPKAKTEAPVKTPAKQNRIPSERNPSARRAPKEASLGEAKDRGGTDRSGDTDGPAGGPPAEGAPAGEGGLPSGGQAEGGGTGETLPGGTAEDATLRVKPRYPRAARQRGEEGTVVIRLTVRDGVPIDARVESSSGSPRLDRAALEAAAMWRFRPQVNGEVRIPFLFRLVDPDPR